VTLRNYQVAYWIFLIDLHAFPYLIKPNSAALFQVLYKIFLTSKGKINVMIRKSKAGSPIRRYWSMTIYLLDNTLQIDIFYDHDSHDLEDNICVAIIERCPPQERLLQAGETHIFLTPDQAQQLGLALLEAVEHSKANTSKPGS